MYGATVSAETESTAGSEVVTRTELRLRVIQSLVIDVGAEPDIVLALHPVQVEHRLILIVLPDVGHVQLGDPDVLIGVEVEDRHAALEVARPVQARKAEQTLSLILSDVGVFD